MDVRNLNLASRPISELFGDNPELLYEMPKFQREYVWKKNDWEKFFKDLTSEDNGHFLGSIIGIEPPTMFEKNPRIIVIDGQQRLTTISLYLAALYNHIRFYKVNFNEDQQTDFNTLKRRLVQKTPGKFTRVIPQNQNNNLNDYRWLLGNIEVTVEKYEKPRDAERRRIVQAYNYFTKEIQKFIKDEDDKLSRLFELVEKVMAAILVVITVKSYSDAFQLFESLNNRGQDLNKTDLLKNIVLSRVSDDVQIDEYAYSKWTHIIDNIGETVSEQERFFRNNYNAFRREFNSGDMSYPIAKSATQSNLLDIYAELMPNNPKELLETTCDNSYIYAQILLKKTEGLSKEMRENLRNLNDAEGTTSYILIMHLLKNKENLQLSEQDIIKVISAATKFQVKRNMTKFPQTNKMIPFFNGIVQAIDSGEKKGNEVVQYLCDELRDFSASDELFEKSLGDNVYTANKSTTTLILRILSHEGMTAEDERDLWKVDDNGNPIWTIEHILPQGENLPSEWISMIANGDEEEAAEIQKRYVHTIGNLTITGFNSNLSNKPFAEKRDMKNAAGKYIGYKNGLNLNEDVCDKDEWTTEEIRNRSKKLVKRIISLFSI